MTRADKPAVSRALDLTLAAQLARHCLTATHHWLSRCGGRSTRTMVVLELAAGGWLLTTPAGYRAHITHAGDSSLTDRVPLPSPLVTPVRDLLAPAADDAERLVLTRNGVHTWAWWLQTPTRARLLRRLTGGAW